jgi:septal ring factor EnvC (AmiA/AmiB activator)
MIRVYCCLALALLLSLPVGPVAAQKADPAAAGAGQTKEDLARIRNRIRTLEKQTREDQSRRQALDRQLREAETGAARIRRELAATRRELAEAQRRMAELNRQLDETRATLEREREALAGQVRLAHLTGGREQVRTFFNGQDPADIDRRITWLGYLARSRGELLAAIRESLEALQVSLAAITEQKATLLALESRRQAQLAELEGSRKERAAVMARLDAQVKGKNRQLAAARTQAKSLERVLRDLERAAARARQKAKPPPGKPAPAAPAGRPLGKGRWPVNGQLLADFGQPRAGGQMRWDGVLIAAPAGTEVRTVRAGQVVYADWLPGLGLLLVVDHGAGYLSLYGHNQDLARKVGDRVSAGDLVARVGDTGGQSRPALYYEVRRNGRPVNPRQWGN